MIYSLINMSKQVFTHVELHACCDVLDPTETILYSPVNASLQAVKAKTDPDVENVGIVIFLSQHANRRHAFWGHSCSSHQLNH